MYSNTLTAMPYISIKYHYNSDIDCAVTINMPHACTQAGGKRPPGRPVGMTLPEASRSKWKVPHPTGIDEASLAVQVAMHIILPTLSYTLFLSINYLFLVRFIRTS